MNRCSEMFMRSTIWGMLLEGVKEVLEAGVANVKGARPPVSPVDGPLVQASDGRLPADHQAWVPAVRVASSGSRSAISTREIDL